MAKQTIAGFGSWFQTCSKVLKIFGDTVEPGYDILIDGGEMGALMRSHNWIESPIGPPLSWPQPLRTMIRLLLTCPYPMFIWWGPNLIQFYNDAYRSTMGYERHPRALGQGGQECWAEIWDTIGPQIAQVMAGGNATWNEDQLIPLTRNGQREDLWWTYSHSPIPDPAAPNGIGGVLVICNDVTTAHNAHEALRRAEERTRHALSAANGIGTWDWDVGSDRVSADANFARIYGVDPAEAAMGVSLALFTRNIHPDDKPVVEAAIARSIELEADLGTEYRLIQDDSSVRWVAVSGRPLRSAKQANLKFPGIAIDITDRKRTEERLRDLNENLVEIVNQREKDLRETQAFTKLALSALSGVGVWTFDIARNHFICDEAISELCGINPERGKAGIVPSGFLMNVHPDDLTQLKNTISNPLVSDDLEIEYRICHPDGSTRWVLMRGHTYLDDAGNAIRRTGVGVDMTRQRLLEEQLRQSQKMEAIGQLVGGVAHDFNNLLTAITGTFQLLSFEAKSDKTLRILEVNRVAIDRSQKLVAQLLAFSRKQTLNPISINVNQIASVFELLLEQTLGEHIKLQWQLAADIAVVQVDPGYLQSSLLNLLLNAKDAMPHGGKLAIFSRNQQISNIQARSLEIPPGDYVVLGVTDTGSGMTSEVKARAIEPFFTTKDIGKGTGLGLSQCYGYARQSGGTLVIQSEIGKGTTVSLYFPVSKAAARNIKDTLRTILLVEDEVNVRTVTAEVLRAIGHIVIEAEDANDALSKLDGEVPIDFLFTDIILPNGLNGVQLSERVGKLQPEIKTILASGYPRDTLRDTTKLKDNVVFLKKPYSLKDLTDNFGGSVPEQKGSSRRDY